MSLQYLQIYQYIHSDEGSKRKHTYKDEQQTRYYILTRDPRALEYSTSQFEVEEMGVMSKKASLQHIFAAVASVTLLTRYVIEAGMAEEIAYAISDLFLQQLNLNMSPSAIKKWNYDMNSTFLSLLPPITIEGDVSEREPTHISSLIKDTLNYIQKSPNKSLTIQEVAKKFYVTPDYLSHKFHEELGITFSQFIRSQKISLAKMMLKNPDTSLAEIAHNLGYCSQSYFTKVFREETGYTPKNYIKQVINNS